MLFWEVYEFGDYGELEEGRRRVSGFGKEVGEDERVRSCRVLEKE